MAPDRPEATSTSGAPEDAAEDTPPANGETTVIGAALIMRGELTVHGDLVVYGSLDGAVVGGVRNVLVGKYGKFKADVQTNSVDVAGVIDGNVTCDEKITLRRTAVVRGKHSAREFKIEDFSTINKASLSGKIVPAKE